MDLFTKEEIQTVEKAFGHSYLDDQERLSVIQCNETKDIIACPGSGKTHCLAAKLFLLVNQLPLENNAGICILGHTNNTIDIIKDKLETKAAVYSSYPHFLGTIQSFVDRFLAIPANIHYFNSRPHSIDLEVYESMILKFFMSYPWRSPHKMREWAYANAQYKGIEPEEFILRIRHNSSFEGLIENFRERKILKLKNNNTKYQAIFEYKINLLENGILHYDDAYLLAEKYLNDYEDILRIILSHRFKYVFIDEMQDTAKHQLDITNKCFDNSVIIQRFGDPNQAIFSNTGNLKSSRAWDISNNKLTINSSKRYHQEIADVVSRLTTESLTEGMKGEGTSIELPPVILKFNDDNREKVIETFAKIIKKYTLSNKKYPFKAIGWVGKNRDKNNDKLSIPKYCFFEQKKKRDKKDFPCLKGYLAACNAVNPTTDGFNPYKDIILRCLAKIIRTTEITLGNGYLSATNLEKYMLEGYKDQYQDLRIRITKWSQMLSRGESIYDEMVEYIQDIFIKSFTNKKIKLRNFLVDEYEKNITPPTNANDRNKIKYNDVDIEISTIHGAKGETHEATLYLETYYNKKTDIEDIVLFLIKRNTHSNKTQKTRLKMSYVGMSRARSLLCVAAHKDSIIGYEEDLRGAGWDVLDVNNLL